MNFIQGTLQMLEVGKGAIVVRLIPIIVTVAVLIGWLNFAVYHGLNDPQSMDNAQLARQISRGQGFTTEFLRPHALAQFRGYATKQKLSSDLFPAQKFPSGAPRVLPDTYNAPGYPCLLAAWFRLLHPNFGQPVASMEAGAQYTPERWIPALNQILLLATAVLVFVLGARLFDQRVAWMTVIAFLLTDLMWQYSLTALSTSLLIFLAAAALYCLQAIFSVGERCADDTTLSFAAAWVWGCVLVILLVAISLTRLQLLVLLVPVIVMLLAMPGARVLLAVFVGLAVIGAVAPWYVHLYQISGSIFGSNAPLVIHGTGAFRASYEGNQIYRATTIPSYEQIFHDAARKEWVGLLWNFQQAWPLLGANPLILFFGASLLHQFKRRRTRLLHWFLFGASIAVVLANSLGEARPEALDPWNSLVILFPGMIVVGAAFFFILLDRLALQLWLLNNLIVAVALVLAAMPLALTVTTTSPMAFNFPPYWPPTIRGVSDLAQPDEWVASDMPWATAWYGDHASLWLPDSVAEFENLYDNVCPVGILMLTPVTWAQPLDNMRTGEDKDWFPLVTGYGVPESFPLPIHTGTGAVPDYTLWSDRPRWPHPQ